MFGDPLEHLFDADALLRRDRDRGEGVEAEVLVDLLPHPLHIGRGETEGWHSPVPSRALVQLAAILR